MKSSSRKEFHYRMGYLGYSLSCYYLQSYHIIVIYKDLKLALISLSQEKDV